MKGSDEMVKGKLDSCHYTVTYTSESNSNRPPFGINFGLVYGYKTDASKAAPESPKHAPLSPDPSLEYTPLADDDLEPTKARALPTLVLPAPLSPDYSPNPEPIEEDPQEADLKDDPEEEPSEEEEEELPTSAASTPVIPDSTSLSEETGPFKEDEIPLPPSIATHIEAWLATSAPPSQPPSLLSPLSSPLPMIPSPPLPSSSIRKYSIPEGAIDRLKVALQKTSKRLADLGTNYRHNSHEIYEASYAHDAWSFTMDRIKELQHQRQDDSDISIRRIRIVEMETIMEMKATIQEAVVEGRCTLLVSEIKKLETELWNLMVKGTDVKNNTQRFKELVLLCLRMVLNESDKVERYVGGLPDSIHESKQGYYKSDYPKLKNQNRGNKTRNGEARRRAYALGGDKANLDSNIVTTGSESRPPMLNKENYVPWSSRLLRYAKSRPNGKLIHNSILNGTYVKRMIRKPGDVNRDVNVTKTFHLQTDDELNDKEIKQIEADDQAI
uniref:Reverse transcriptase domain-containing protein n=1 Tax=Tanacetum cinerariifolium TaxID=118510 RepID=A0A6L2KDM3_TANCI|nr:reverse transcriptase domain-containing protein [Tanacetum cinerariifolium]